MKTVRVVREPVQCDVEGSVDMRVECGVECGVGGGADVVMLWWCVMW